MEVWMMHGGICWYLEIDRNHLLGSSLLREDIGTCPSLSGVYAERWYEMVH